LNIGKKLYSKQGQTPGNYVDKKCVRKNEPMPDATKKTVGIRVSLRGEVICAPAEQQKRDNDK
jgi:hypothetical protein